MPLLRRFLQITEGYLETVEAQIPLIWIQQGDPDTDPFSPPVSPHFRLCGTGLGLPNAMAVENAQSLDLGHADARSLHVLATAEHALALFAGGVNEGLPRWVDPLPLWPQYEQVSGWTEIADYTGDRIRFQCLAGGPFACANHDIVVHEVGHAILDDFRGWTKRIDREAGAVSETLSDLLAMFSAGESLAVCSQAVNETGGDFLGPSNRGQSNRLSRFGEIPPRPGAAAACRRDAINAPGYEVSLSGDEYQDASPLTKALYMGFAYHLHAAASNAPQPEQVQTSLRELAGAVFGAITTITSDRVTRRQFVRAAIAQASSSFRPHMSQAARDQGFL